MFLEILIYLMKYQVWGVDLQYVWIEWTKFKECNFYYSFWLKHKFIFDGLEETRGTNDKVEMRLYLKITLKSFLLVRRPSYLKIGVITTYLLMV